MTTPTLDRRSIDAAPRPARRAHRPHHRRRRLLPRPARRRRCPARCASSTRGPSCATRSCSWSGSGRCWSPARPSPSPSVFAWLIADLAVVHRAVRQPGRGGGRGPRQGAGREPAPHPHRDHGPPADRRRHRDGGARHRAEGRRPGGGRGRPGHPRRRRHRRGHRHRRRVGHHRRVGSGDPRVRRRPLVGHRRHHRAVRPDRRADHRGPRRVLRRPHDRAGRGGRAAEDPERDRADHPARPR